MIRNPQDALLEMQVVEREARFLHGLRWHLKTLLGDLEREEQMLLPTMPLETASVSTRGQPMSTMITDIADAAPGTPKMHALLGLDPLGTSRSSTAVELPQETSSSSFSASEPELFEAAPPKRPKLATSHDFEQNHGPASGMSCYSQEDQSHLPDCSSSSEEQGEGQRTLYATG